VLTGGSFPRLSIYVINPSGIAFTYIDDMRLQPVNSPVFAYVYDEQTGLLSAVLDNEIFATFYTYDNAGCLIKTEKETAVGIKKANETSYRYERTP